MNPWISVEDVKFLLSFAPKDTPESVPKGMSPEFYLTLDYDDEVKLAERVERIRQLLAPPETK